MAPHAPLCPLKECPLAPACSQVGNNQLGADPPRKQAGAFNRSCACLGKTELPQPALALVASHVAFWASHLPRLGFALLSSFAADEVADTYRWLLLWGVPFVWFAPARCSAGGQSKPQQPARVRQHRCSCAGNCTCRCCEPWGWERVNHSLEGSGVWC